MNVYDNYEISGCRRLNKKGRPHPNGPYTETCDDSQAQFWTLYGHINGEGVEAIGDFSTRAAVEQVYSRITGLPFTGSYEADARLRVMHAGPKLLEALQGCLFALDENRDGFGPSRARAKAVASVVVAEATGNCPPEPREPIVIEVRAGVVQEVLNVPPAYEYEIKDYDNLEADEDAEAERAKGSALPSALPPDPEGMNNKRASWAGRAVAAFQDATGTDGEDALSDLLADVMHWADRNNYDFEAALLRGRDHYKAETIEEEAA